MDALVAVFVIICIVGAITRGANKVSHKRPGQQPQGSPAQTRPQPAKVQPGATRVPASRPRPAPAARPRPAQKPDTSWQKNFPPELRKALGMEEPEHLELKPEEPREEGESRMEADGCIGGSLPHPAEPAEPVIRAGAPKMPEPAASKPVASPAPERAFVPATSAADLRRAVVMAEILARPVALRPRGYRL